MALVSVRLIPPGVGLPVGFAANPRVSGLAEEWVYVSIDTRLTVTASPEDVRACSCFRGIVYG